MHGAYNKNYMKINTYIVGLIAVAFMLTVMAPQATYAATNDTASKIEALLEKIRALQDQLRTIRGDVRETLRDGLKEGMTNDDVRKIQELLSSDSDVYPFGKATGFFGPLTKDAVKKFQKKAGLAETGIVDSETRKLMEEMLADRYNGKIPAGLLRAPGIYKKYMDRIHSRGDDCVAPFCKNDDNDKDKDKDKEYTLTIDVEFDNGDAEVDIRYKDGTRESFTIDNETNEEDVIDEIVDETELTEEEVRGAIDFEDSDWGADVRSIKTIIGTTTSTSSIRFKDNDISNRTIVLSETDKDDIVDELADQLGLTVTRIDEVIEWESAIKHGIESIEVTFEDDDADIRIEYENGTVSHKNYANVDGDEDEVIERLADDLNLDEDIIEDIVEFDS